jgi:hypothetical protein
MSEPSAAPATTRVAGSRSGLRVAVGVAAALILLAALKPWAPAAGAQDGRSLAAATPGTAAGSPAPPPTTASASPPAANDPEPSPAPGEMTCQVEDWQIASLDRLADWTVRTWTPAGAAAASGPLDPAIPVVRLDSPRVLGLGVCVPDAVAAQSRSDGVVTSIWRIAGHRATDVAFEPLVAAPARAPRPGITLLYRPARDPSAWAPGRYVVALEAFGARGERVGRMYLGVDVPGGQ